jgi:hypothetical protein
MNDEVKPNKLNDKDKRRMENVRDELRKQGVGEDDATRRAREQVIAEGTSGKGGGNSGGEAKK